MAGGGFSISRKTSSQRSRPVLLPEQKIIWNFLTQQLIPQALGRDTIASRIGEQSIRDESARLLNLQRQQAQGLATQGVGAGQRATLLSEAGNAAVQGTLRNILNQRQASQQQALGLLQGLPLQPGQQSRARSSAWSHSGYGGS